LIKNILCEPEWWRHTQRFVDSVRKSWTPNATVYACSACSVRGTCLHFGTRSQTLSTIGAMERDYSWPTFNITATSHATPRGVVKW